MQLRYRLTPLTTFVIRNLVTQDRFTFNQVRNADSYGVMPGVELKPFALVSGSAFVGAKRFDTLDSRVTDYQGLVAAVDARYALASMQFAIKVARDIAFSYAPCSRITC